jgi:Amt family ammonium transporter
LIPGWLGFGWFGIAGDSATAAAGNLNPQASFLFQVAFAATAATIVSGAVAGRMSFRGYLIYTAVLTGLIYPISGFWQWGGGWLGELGFHDFAGSLVVHAVGGFAGLAGAIVLGPRIGRFVNGKSYPMPGHNLGYAALGVFLLWVGWYGFNPGSQLAFTGQANTDLVMKIAVNTTLAAGAGGVLAMLTSWVMFKKPDLTMALNGILAGLVGITANCDVVSNYSSVAIGAIAGGLVVFGVLLLDRLRIDDPVGAWPVHGLCGVWGGVATGLFGSGAVLWIQILGSLVFPLWAFATMFGLFFAMKLFGILRVSPEEERAGLDIGEHGMHAYPAPLVIDSLAGTPIGGPSLPASQPSVLPKASPETA